MDESKGFTFVCPRNDVVCGDDPREWCGVCPLLRSEAQPARTLLDEFAMAAIPLVTVALHDTPRREGVTIGQHAAEIAYAIAKRMMQERAK